MLDIKERILLTNTIFFKKMLFNRNNNSFTPNSTISNGNENLNKSINKWYMTRFLPIYLSSILSGLPRCSSNLFLF